MAVKTLLKKKNFSIENTLTKNLQILLGIYHYSMAELGAVCGVSQPTLRQLIRNPKRLTVDHLTAISDLTGFGVCDLLTKTILEEN